MNPGNGGWLILLTIVTALIAAIVHLPETWPAWLGWLRPAWVPLVLFLLGYGGTTSSRPDLGVAVGLVARRVARRAAGSKRHATR